jgi:hypothetical protein
MGYTLWAEAGLFATDGFCFDESAFSEVFIFFYFNLQIYTTVLKFIKTIYQPPWRTVVSRSRRTLQRLHPNRRGPRRLLGVHGD